VVFHSGKSNLTIRESNGRAVIVNYCRQTDLVAGHRSLTQNDIFATNRIRRVAQYKEPTHLLARDQQIREPSDYHVASVLRPEAKGKVQRRIGFNSVEPGPETAARIAAERVDGMGYFYRTILGCIEDRVERIGLTCRDAGPRHRDSGLVGRATIAGFHAAP